MMIKPRKILAQGDRDGACFLYSIANATFALTKKEVDRTKWAKCVHALPFEMTDYMAGLGTEKLDPLSKYIEGFALSFMSVLNIEPTVYWVKEVRSLIKLKSLINANQVFVMSVYEDSHWLTVVDVEGSKIFIACSAEALDGDDPYSETKSPNLKRFYNKISTFKELRVEKGFGLLISNIVE